MTDAFYIDIRDNVADQLIKDFGKPLTIRAEGSTAVFDGESGFITVVGTPVTHNVTGVFVEFKQSEIDGTTVLSTDFKVLLSAVDPITNVALTIVPTTEMTLLDGTEEFVIVDVRPTKPGGIDVIYTLQVRG